MENPSFMIDEHVSQTVCKIGCLIDKKLPRQNVTKFSSSEENFYPQKFMQNKFLPTHFLSNNADENFFYRGIGLHFLSKILKLDYFAIISTVAWRFQGVLG